MQNPRTLNVVARGITEAGTFALLQHHACGTNHEASMSSTYVWKATFASTVIPMVMDGTEHQQSSRTFIGILEAQLNNAALNGQGLGRALSHTYPTKCHSNANQNYLPMFATRSRREVRFRKPRIPHNFAGPILICGPDRAHMSDVNRKPACPRHTTNIHKRTYFFVFCWGLGRQSHTHTHTHHPLCSGHIWRLASIKTVCAWKPPNKTFLYQWTFMRPKKRGGKKTKISKARLPFHHGPENQVLETCIKSMSGVKQIFQFEIRSVRFPAPSLYYPKRWMAYRSPFLDVNTTPCSDCNKNSARMLIF